MGGNDGVTNLLGQDHFCSGFGKVPWAGSRCKGSKLKRRRTWQAIMCVPGINSCAGCCCSKWVRGQGGGGDLSCHGARWAAAALEHDIDMVCSFAATVSGVELEEDDEGDGSPGNKKKIGRPRKYDGPLDNPNLTEPERRRIKRRIANRESAARVRNRRTVLITELHDQVG